MRTFIYLLLTFFSTSVEAQNSSANKLEKFACEYRPPLTVNVGVNKLPYVNKDLLGAINNLMINDTAMCEKYLSLILLKLYKSHLNCCHQSYDLKTGRAIDSLNNPIVFAFIKCTRMYNLNEPIEFISSSMGYEWVLNNKWVLRDKRLNKEFILIKKLRKD